jgi:valyl-tRNA synthetase
MEVIASHGSDALRLGIVAARSAGQNQAFSTSKVVAGRNLCNKLWNIARFVQNKLSDDFKPSEAISAQSTIEHWIAGQLEASQRKITANLKAYRFAEAADEVYSVIWNSVADWFIEGSKLKDNPPLMAWVLETCLKLAHPFAPFVTETIWQDLNWTDSILATEAWPSQIKNQVKFDPNEATQFEQVKALVSEVRFATSELPGSKYYNLLFKDDSLVSQHQDLIKALSRVHDVLEVADPRGMRLAVSHRNAWLDVEPEVLAQHESNLKARYQATKAEVQKLEARLANKGYLAKAPAHLVEQTRHELGLKKHVLKRLALELGQAV